MISLYKPTCVRNNFQKRNSLALPIKCVALRFLFPPTSLRDLAETPINKEKSQFYAISKGSLTELESQFLISRDLGYVSDQEFADIEGKIGHVGKILTGLAKVVGTGRAL